MDHLSQVRNQKQALGNMTMNLRVQYNIAHFLTRWVTTSLSRKGVFHGVISPNECLHSCIYRDYQEAFCVFIELIGVETFSKDVWSTKWSNAQGSLYQSHTTLSVTLPVDGASSFGNLCIHISLAIHWAVSDEHLYTLFKVTQGKWRYCS
jgi:hypothetical protein